MKKIKNITSCMAGLVLVVALAAVLSCEENERWEIKSDAPPKNSSAATVARIGAVNFDGSEGAALDLATAKAWVANYKKKNTNPDEVSAHYFGTAIIKDILNQPGCVGIRIYYALDEAGEKKLILVGVDSKGENLLPSTNGRSMEDDNTIADFSLPCPSYCPDNEL